MKGGIYSQIGAVREELPSSSRKVADYVLTHMNQIARMTIHQLAEESDTSAAAVVRFCRALGLKGYPELRMRISADTARTDLKGYHDIEKDERPVDLIEKTLSNSIQALQDTAKQLNDDRIADAIDVIDQARAIYFYGIGASHVVAEDAAQKWTRVGKLAIQETDQHLLATILANARPEDVFFAISYSGETEEVVELIRLAKIQGLKIISLTRFGDNRISQLADIALWTSRAPEAPLRSAALSSRLAQLFAIDVLFLSYAAGHYEDTLERLQYTRESVKTLHQKK